MTPASGELLHFSEDPTITRFEPHVAATAQQPEAYVWAVDVENAPSYWFPRQCPRGMAWAGPHTSALDRAAILAHCSRELPSHMVPRHLDLLTELPLLPNGKVDYRQLEASWVEPGAPA